MSDSTASSERFGRYAVRDVLGRGGFGTVFLGFDEELQRNVAIKVPHRECVASEKDVENYMSEARLVARLQHEGVASVHDVGRTADGMCYVVSQYIDGESLAARLRSKPPTLRDSVRIVSDIADTLQYVHRQGIVHRDIKPGNILLSLDDRVYLTDFGLALTDEQASISAYIVGTPKYMSPEQARGESHLVDPRSDIFSLGIVLYRMIAGVEPFGGNDPITVLDEIISLEPKLPRQFNPQIPHALQRVCLKALSKQISQRYANAEAFAADLKSIQFDDEAGRSVVTQSFKDQKELASTIVTQVGVTPRGLRSFENADAHFFMRLLPGPYDRRGTPESLHFWKTRIESDDPDETFRVGVIYGPSGCGKSSLVKAGLLPILNPSVETLFVEAAPERTEQRLQSRLSRSVQGDQPRDLASCLKFLRNHAEPGTKTLIVIDQFEQWLHAVEDPNNSDLANALRQCDGIHLQCILLVRDDFWLSVSRFMSCLDIDLAQNQNMRLVDLFDAIHARRVLTEFGCGHGRLPGNLANLTDEQNQFLDAAIDGLLQHNRIIPVRLALFAEMLKGRVWEQKTLRELGGMEGVGPRFLEECFDTATAPAEQRVHRNAVHRTLRALLPDMGTDIKGAMKSYDELLDASGYREQPDQFRNLIRILDSNLRLITPTDPMGLSAEDSISHSGIRFYQLTHDFLVPAIREWISVAESSSRAGRSEKLLRDLSANWKRRPGSRSLPGGFEWLQIQLFSDRRRWTPTQKQMIATATRRFVLTVGVVVGIVLGATLTLHYQKQSARAASLVSQLSTSTLRDVPGILEEIQSVKKWAIPRLQDQRSKLPEDSAARTFFSLALWETDTEQRQFLEQRLLECPPQEEALILETSSLLTEELTAELWTTLEDAEADPGRRFRAALALARCDPPADGNSDRWSAYDEFLAQSLIDSANLHLTEYPAIVSLAEPLSVLLQKTLGRVLADVDSDRVRAATARQLLVDLLRERPADLADQIVSATPEHVQAALPTLDQHRAEIVSVLNDVVAQGYSDSLTTEEWLLRARRQANAATLLLRSDNTAQAWNLLRDSAQPDARTYLIDRIRPFGVDPGLLVARLRKETDRGIRNGLMLALGTFNADDSQINEADRQFVVDTVRSWYQQDPAASVHSTSRWLLERWQGSEETALIKVETPDDQRAGWKLDSTGLVMVTMRPPDSSIQPFEIAATETTCRLMLSVLPDYFYESEWAPHPDTAVPSASWFEAVEFCQQLTLRHGLTESDQCYEQTADTERFRLKSNFRELRGYRLPLEAEWEYCLLAGAESKFACGNDVHMLDRYEVINSEDPSFPSQQPGTRMPNAFGLFDMNGNLSEWCTNTDIEGRRPLRGGTRRSTLQTLLEDPLAEGHITPEIRFRSVGFRVARSAVE